LNKSGGLNYYLDPYLYHHFFGGLLPLPGPDGLPGFLLGQLGLLPITFSSMLTLLTRYRKVARVLPSNTRHNRLHAVLWIPY